MTPDSVFDDPELYDQDPDAENLRESRRDRRRRKMEAACLQGLLANPKIVTDGVLAGDPDAQRRIVLAAKSFAHFALTLALPF
mgnify:CR=1 FL=1